LQFRRDVLKPFFDQYLKDGAPKADTPPVFIYNTGENHWDRFTSWPQSCDRGCAAKPRALYLTAGLGLAFNAPARGDSKAAYDEYVSDPANRCRTCRVPCASRLPTRGNRGPAPVNAPSPDLPTRRPCSPRP